MLFKKEDLLDYIYINKVQERIIGKSRWNIEYECVFDYEGKFYRTNYSCGATECQDGGPFEYEPDEIECPEVFSYPVTVMKFLTKEEYDAGAN